MRIRNGHDLPNPEMQLRAGGAWRPVYEQLAADWIDAGRGGDRDTPPLAMVGAARELVSGAVEPA